MDKDTEAIAADTKRALHINMLWDDEIIEIFRQRFYNAVWVFARNITEMPLVTSDNPIIFKTSDNRMWLKHGVLTKGTYAVFPISPTIVMYAYDGGFPRYASLRKFDCSLSPVSLTEGMIEQENTGQAFAAWRFVISPRNEFSAIRDFAETIGTDRYAPKT
jgi:uncharacterized protein DUF4238